jgi:ketosteroid isomerase-like protein
MSDTETACRLFAAYLAQDVDTGRNLLADDFRFTSPQDDHIDKAAFMERCFPTATRVEWQTLLEVTQADGGVFVMYEYKLETGEVHRNAEYLVVRDGRVAETNVFFGGRYDGS